MYRIWNHIWHVRYWIIFVTVFCHVRIMSLDYLLLCGLSLLLVLSFAPRGFSPGTPVFPSPQKLTFPNSNSTRNQAWWRTILWMCYLQIITYFFLSLLLLYFGFKINRQSSKLTPHWDTLFHEVHKRRFQTLTPVEDKNRSFCNPV